MPVQTSRVENELINQKNILIDRIDASTSVEQCEECLKLIYFIAPMWDALHYGYKTTELKARLKENAIAQIEEHREFLSHERANYRGRGHINNEIERLERVVATCKG